METSLKIVVSKTAPSYAIKQKIKLAQALAALHFADGHIRNPYKKCNSEAYNAYESAAMALIKGL